MKLTTKDLKRYVALNSAVDLTVKDIVQFYRQISGNEDMHLNKVRVSNSVMFIGLLSADNSSSDLLEIPFDAFLDRKEWTSYITRYLIEQAEAKVDRLKYDLEKHKREFIAKHL